MKMLVQGVRTALECQSDDGRYNVKPTEKNSPAAAGLNLSIQRIIYPVAYLYRTDHALNPFSGDSRLLESAVRCGDLLADYKPETVWPMDSWTLSAWLEAYDLLKDSLPEEKKAGWAGRIEHWARFYLEYIEKSRGKREYTAVQLGISPNHYSLFLAMILRAGHILGHPEWTELATGEFRNILRSQHPDGYWAEHHGPVNIYNRLTLHGVGLYYAFTGDPEALEVMRRAKDFVLGFTYPDGSLVSVIDERNRYSANIRAAWGLLSLSHFPDGRRFNRLMAQKALGLTENRPGSGGRKEKNSGQSHSIPIVSLNRVIENFRYSAAGPESDAAPQELSRYDARLLSGAYLMRRGDWVVCLSGIISPPWEGNRFFLDRYTYLEVWHQKTGLLIGGGNTKHQPQIAGLLLEPSHSGLDFRPLESRITAEGDSMRLELRFEKFRATLKASILDNRTLKLESSFHETTPPILWPNRFECNLQLQLKAGDRLTCGTGRAITLSPDKRIRLMKEDTGAGLETEAWRIEVPNGKTSFRFPFLPFNNYDIDGTGPPSSAVAILSSSGTGPEAGMEYLLKIK